MPKERNISLHSPLSMPIEDRPRERLLRLGADSLSVVELLAVLLGSGTRAQPVLQLSQAILAQFGSLEKIADATIAELNTIKGLGMAKAIQIKAACSLAKRLICRNVDDSQRIDSPQRAYNALQTVFNEEKRELFVALLLDIKSCLISHSIISIGSLNETIVHPREVFYPAIRNKAASLLIAHNHPSGDPAPSKQDILLTKQLINAGDIVGIPINDHIIVGKESYASFRELGLCF